MLGNRFSTMTRSLTNMLHAYSQPTHAFLPILSGPKPFTNTIVHSRAPVRREYKCNRTNRFLFYLTVDSVIVARIVQFEMINEIKRF